MFNGVRSQKGKGYFKHIANGVARKSIVSIYCMYCGKGNSRGIYAMHWCSASYKQRKQRHKTQLGLPSMEGVLPLLLRVLTTSDFFPLSSSPQLFQSCTYVHTLVLLMLLMYIHTLLMTWGLHYYYYIAHVCTNACVLYQMLKTESHIGDCTCTCV